MRTVFFLFALFFISHVLAQENTVLIYSDAAYENILKYELETFKKDLEEEGWNTKFLFKGEEYHSYHEFQKELKLQYSIHGMKGVVLVGSFPYEDDHLIACSKCTFFNSFVFSIKPDFWVSRIDPSLVVYIDNLSLLEDYFRRNHEYRRSNYNYQNLISSPSYAYLDKYSYFIQALKSLGGYMPKLVYNSHDFWEALNESDAAITEISVHGTSSTLSINNQHIDSIDILYRSQLKSSFLDLYSCEGGKPVNGNPASAFLFAQNSKVLAVSARSAFSSSLSQVYAHYLNSISGGVGDIFLENYSWANHAMPHYNGRILLGDGTLKLEK
ncbi:hypothetical protein [Endozoicomonas sp. 8E]|uniref:hypothetical protein n=1 Tax=Endozoicomonas sp. 8E TaxID=3035692 RepID=UPI00293934E4|nr:hypothetical protein [Endozoicomonas sp. 8E]WOG30166.1 hypothetical protein P6910_11125 [Endozoicomonas sp. 8E]